MRLEIERQQRWNEKENWKQSRKLEIGSQLRWNEKENWKHSRKLEIEKSVEIERKGEMEGQ